MTKIFIAQPPVPQPPITPPQSYSLSPGARALELTESEIIKPLQYPIPGKGRYVPDGGYEFNFELNVLDTESKLPIRAVDIKSGEKKTFTDKLGRAVLRLPRGHNEVVIEGFGYLEKQAFAPEAVKFEPILLKVDLDSDSIYTIYSTGQIVVGERRVLGNPGHNPGEFSEWLGKYWWALGLVGATGFVMYNLGKSGAQKT